MASHRDPPNIADISASHIDHLNRIPGIKVPENGWSMSLPGRQLLSSKMIFGEHNSLSDRQRANGTVLIQCVDFFAEFLPGHKKDAPASLDDKEYEVAFWTLIKDMLPYDEPKLTRKVLKHVYDLLTNARSRFNLAHPLRELNNLTKEEKWFLTCLDEHEAHRLHGFSEAQLKYGERHDEDFAVCLATRVNQWRHLTRNTINFRNLLFMLPVLSMDVTPVEQWDEKFFQDATDYAIRFHKPAPQIPKVDDASSPKSKSKDSREFSMLRRMSLQMATLTGLVSKVDEKVTNINKNVVNTQHDVVGIKEDVKELTKSHSAISKAVYAMKTHLVDRYNKVLGKDSDHKKGGGGAVMSNKRPRTAEWAADYSH